MGDQDGLFTDLFAQAMQQVQTLEKSDKIDPVRTKIKKNHRAMIQHIAEPHEYTHQPLRASNLQAYDDDWTLRTSGVGKSALKKLANGQPCIYQSIDLHGMTRNKAIQTLEQCMQTTLLAGGRVIAVIHGRGLHSQNGRPVLKHSIYQWLKSGAMSHHILAVIPAPESAGGSCLVLLRRDKSR